MNLVWENLELNRKKHGLRKLGIGQVSLGSKGRHHTSVSLKGKKEENINHNIQETVQLFAFYHLVNSFLFEHFNSPFSGTRSGGFGN